MRCAVVGDPVAHSLSPVLHRAAYGALGLDWTYEAVRVPPGTLAGHLDGLDSSWRGLSLTMPLKREVLPLLDDVSPTARRAGAANTLLLDPDGRRGDNTDVPGAVAALRPHLAGPPGRAAILGGGATAASTGVALADLGCARLDLHVRRPETAEETRRLLAAHPAAPEVRVRGLDEAVEVDVVVSTVPAGAQTPDLVARCAEVPVVFEVLYDPWPTPLAAAALADGRALATGLDLLVHQAAIQVRLFTGRPGPVEAMFDAGRAALAARAAGEPA